MKFAATILALALATTHGLLDEGDHNVQKKDASKGLRGSAVDSSLERAAVGRKLDFYTYCPPFTTYGPDRTKCGVCSESGKECNLDQSKYISCDEGDGGTCSLDQSRVGIPPCDKKCRCCDGTEPDVLTGACDNYATICSGDGVTPCNDSQDCAAGGGPGGLCEPVTSGDCAVDEVCCDGSIGTPAQCATIKCDPTPTPTTTTTQPPTPFPTPCPKKLDVCVAVDRSGSICSSISNDPQVCRVDEPCLGIPCEGEDTERCDFADGCPSFNDVDPEKENEKRFVTTLINELNLSFMGVNDELRVSIVTFAGGAEEITPLTAPELATTTVNGIGYTGGYTNLEKAIAGCRETLSSSAAGSEVIVAVSDGEITTFGDDIPEDRCTGSNKESEACENAATVAADDAKADGITIATAFALFDAGKDPTFLESIASSPELFVTDAAFPDAGILAEKILSSVSLCSSD